MGKLKLSQGMFVFPKSNNVYVDTEWIEAWNKDEKEKYYYCTMLNHGHCFKYYKPSIAALMLKRGAYLKMEQI